MTILLSEHGEKRVKQRIGLPKKAARKLALRAIAEGARREQFTGSMRLYLDQEYRLKGGAADNMRVLNGYLFVFSGEMLITCWLLPEKFRRARPKAVTS